MPGSPSSCSRVAVLRSTGAVGEPPVAEPAAAPPAEPTAGPGADRIGGRPRRCTSSCSPSTRTRARLTLASRAVAVRPPAARTASATREPVGSRTRPGRRTAPTTCTTTSAGAAEVAPVTAPGPTSPAGAAVEAPASTGGAAAATRCTAGAARAAGWARHSSSTATRPATSRTSTSPAAARRLGTQRTRTGADARHLRRPPGRRGTARHPASCGTRARRPHRWRRRWRTDGLRERFRRAEMAQPSQQGLARGAGGSVGSPVARGSRAHTSTLGSRTRRPCLTTDRWTDPGCARRLPTRRRQRGATTTASMPGPTWAPTTAPTSLT